MQNLDPSGEYSDAEVKDALSGASGTREWSFRYERLDKNNNYIDDIDYIDSCVIDNNIFADIKRTAKFRVHDQGNINYLQDRIKPYAILDMPEDESYSKYARALDPDIHYVMNDAAQTALTPTAVTVPESNLYSTFADALLIKAGQAIYPRIMPSSTTVRKTFWAKFVTSPVETINIIGGVTGVGNKFSVYTLVVPEGALEGAVAITEDNLVLQGEYSSGQIFTLNDPAPEAATYYFKYEALTVAEYAFVEYGRPIRIFDSSGNRYHANAVNVTPVKGIVLDEGGKAQRVTGNITKPSKTVAIPSSHLFSGSFWINMTTPLTTNMAILCESADSFLQINVNGITGQIAITTGLGAWATGLDFIKTFAEGPEREKLNRVKHIAWSVNLENGTGSVWLDGVQHTLTGVRGWGEYDPTYNTTSTISTVIISNLTSGTVPYVIDDVALFFHDLLVDSEVRNLYRLGTKVNKVRKGFVEWPQGVFLLSSPSRVFSEGNTSFREVDAYDQLLVLKEDSYESRYTVRKGSNCVEEIEKIIGSITRKNFQLFLNNAATPTGVFTGITSVSGVTIVGTTYTSPEKRPGGVGDSNMLKTTLSTSTAKPAGATFTGTVSLQAIGKTVTFSTWLLSSNTINLRTTINRGPEVEHRLVANKWTKIVHTEKLPNVRTPNQTTFPASVIVDLPAGSTTINMTETIIEEGDLAGPFFSFKTSNNTGYTHSWFSTPEHGTYGYSLAQSNNHHVVPSSQTFTEAMEWEPGTSKLQVVNDILAYINYESAWFDENGGFIGEPYMSPAQRGSEFTYATDADSVITSDDISQTLDLFSIPNKWVLVVSDPETLPMIGSYTNEDPMSPTSTISRGRTIVDYRTEESASDLATLFAKAERLAFEASQVYEKVEFSTGLMPIHSNADTYDIIVDELAISNKYNETAWSMELSAGSTMKHQVRRIIQI